MTTTDLPQPGDLPEIEVDPSAFRHLADAQVNVELDTGDMVLNIGPQHPATHGTLRLVVRLDGERVIAADPDHRLHAPRLREARRVPHLPADHHADQPHRLALVVRERSAVHPRGRAADGHRSAAARRVHPHDPHRAVAHRNVRVVPRRDGLAGWRDHARVLRVPRPRVRAQRHRGRHGRSVSPQLQPHRRREGRPAVGLDLPTAGAR